MLNFNLRKNMIINILFLTILILLTILITSFSISSVSAEALSENEIDAISKSMTASIDFNENGEQKNVMDYQSYLHTRFELDNRNNDNLNVADEWIEKIVPIELFKQQVEEYFYIGDEYGFYFDYNKANNTY